MIIVSFKKNLIFMVRRIFLLKKFMKETLVNKRLEKKKNIILNYMIAIEKDIIRMKEGILEHQTEELILRELTY
jgi:hypothetical protein